MSIILTIHKLLRFSNEADFVLGLSRFTWRGKTGFLLKKALLLDA